MRRNTLNFIIDCALALAMLGMIMTGLVIRFVLPPGSGQQALWSLTRHEWGDVHFWLAVAIAALALLHVAMHWQWTCMTIYQLVRGAEAGVPRSMVRNIAGVTTVLLLAVLCAGFVWVARGQVGAARQGGQYRGGASAGAAEEPRQRRGRSEQPATRESGAGQMLRGSTSIKEAAAAVGVSVEELRRRLGVPADVPDDQTLGRLSQRLGVSMSELRAKAAGGR